MSKRLFPSFQVHTGSGEHTVSYIMGTEGSFPGGRVAQGVKLTINVHLVPRSGMKEPYLHSLMFIHDEVLN
jgi:hypothetical protein